MLLADFTDVLWMKELPHKELIFTALYNLPGALVLGLVAVVVRMMIEEVLKHISQGLSRSKLWSWLVVIGWIVALKTTSIGDTVARKIHWDQLIPPPGQAAAVPDPAAKQPAPDHR